MQIEDLNIIETTSKDLDNVASLWNDGDVMKFVGFPYGLGVTVKSLTDNWLPNININDKRKHYSIYHQELGYCGECYYHVDETGKAAMDIKLFDKARGKNIAYTSLKFALEQAFNLGGALVCYVDPQKINKKAIALYHRLGFKELPHPNQELAEKHLYLEVSKSNLI